jgi:hypothetical protein
LAAKNVDIAGFSRSAAAFRRAGKKVLFFLVGY